MIALNEKNSLTALKHTDEITIRNRRSLIGLEVDDATLAQLLEIAKRHCYLVLEYGKAQTTAARRLEIYREIQSLRSARDALIEGLKKAQINELAT